MPPPNPAAPPMAQHNRDTERLYPPGKLSFHFAVWSTLLLGVLVWMFWQDHARPWKGYQRRFRERQMDLAVQSQRRYEAQTEGLPAAKRALADAQKALADLPATHPTLKDLEARLPALLEAKERAESEEKQVKGLHAPARYQAEMGEHQSHGPTPSVSPGRAYDLLQALNAWSSAMFRAHRAAGAAQADYDAVAEQVKAIRRPYEEAVKQAEKGLVELRKAETTVGGLQQKYENNQWRNWAVIDFISKTYEIKQVVLKNIHDNWNFATNVKVDRCMTCHLGVDNPDLSDANIQRLFEAEIQKAYQDDPQALERYKADHGFERWMQPHVGLGLIAGPSSPHRVETTGCSVCHHGVGWATDFSRAAHTAGSAAQLKEWEAEHDRKPPEFVEYPMLAKEYIQGQCFKCHKQGFGWPVPYVESLEHGAVAQTRDVPGKAPRRLQPLELYGPLRLPPAPGVVDGSRTEVARVRRLQEQARLGDGFEASMVRDYGWDAVAYDKGEETIIRYGCQGCHKMEAFGDQVGHPAPPRVGPDLSYVADKVRPGWLERWIKHPDAFRLDTRMPSFFWFVPKNADWKPVDADGKEIAAPRPAPVMDSHLWDRDEHLRALGKVSTPADEARMGVQVAAMAQYLLSQGRSRALKGDPAYDPTYGEDPPAGNWEHGRDLVANEGLGCVACHVVPEVQDASGAWVKDVGERFRGEPAKGPRLDGLGSKLKDARWLVHWLERPKHYTATTAMPTMRFRDEVTSDGTVVRTALQARADVAAYLLRFKNEAFDALPGVGWSDSWTDLLRDMYEEYFGRNKAGDLRRPSDVEGEFGQKARGLLLAELGEKLMSRNGCFGCHAVQGHEGDVPIGTDLSKHGTKDLHQLEFAYVHEVPHTRAGFYRTKITHPRIWDHGRVKRWTDQLKMPRFNFRMDDGIDGTVATRAAVAGIVLGQVDEPIQPAAWYHPDPVSRDLIRFRKVVQRYGCNNCHPIEGQASVLWRFLGAPLEVGPDEEAPAPSASFDLKFVPPNLFAEGVRRKADWLMAFLQQPQDLRPLVRQRMPRFELSEEEADALVAGFQRLAGVQVRNRPAGTSTIGARPYADPVEIVVRDGQGQVAATRTVHDAVEEAEFLFDTINCNKCHLPKGSPGADPQDGGVAPPFKVVAGTLHREYVNSLLNDPQHLMRGTSMVTPWQRDGYGRQISPQYVPFQFGLRDDPAWQALWKASEEGKRKGPELEEATQRLAAAQREALADYVVYHYRWPRSPAAEPR